MAAFYPYNEKELLTRIAEGDEIAFSVMVNRYTDIIYPHLLSYIKNAARAEEVTQDIFLRIWNNREKLANIENFGGYVYVITRNRAKTALKEQLADAAKVVIDPLHNILSGTDTIIMEVKELKQTLDKAIASLPARRREVFLLSRTENFTYEEIAEKLGISRSAVRQHIVAALVFLRSYLKEQLGIRISHSGWILLLCDLLVN